MQIKNRIKSGKEEIRLQTPLDLNPKPEMHTF